MGIFRIPAVIPGLSDLIDQRVAAAVTAATAATSASLANKLGMSDVLLDQAADPETHATGTLVVDPAYAGPIGSNHFGWDDGADGVWAPTRDSVGRVAGWTITHVANGLTDVYTQPQCGFASTAVDAKIVIRPPVQVTFAAPASPTLLVAPALTATGRSGSVLLTATAPGAGVTVNFYRSAAATDPWSSPPLVTGDADGSYVDSAVVGGTPYYYRAAFVSGATVGPLSDVQTATPTATTAGAVPTDWAYTFSAATAA